MLGKCLYLRKNEKLWFSRSLADAKGDVLPKAKIQEPTKMGQMTPVYGGRLHLYFPQKFFLDKSNEQWLASHQKARCTMSLCPEKPAVATAGPLLSMSGTILALVGFFLPLVFWQSIGATSIDGQQSQWEMVKDYSSNLSNTWLLWSALVLPFLAALLVLGMSIATLVLQRQFPVLLRWKRSIAVSGAVVEFVVGPFMFLISGILGAKIFVGPGLVLLLLGFIILLVGLRVEQRR
jgi:hypothetical protein